MPVSLARREGVRSMSLLDRRAMIDRKNDLSVRRQFELLASLTISPSRSRASKCLKPDTFVAVTRAE